jgi:hypothetical protein
MFYIRVTWGCGGGGKFSYIVSQEMGGMLWRSITPFPRKELKEIIVSDVSMGNVLRVSYRVGGPGVVS